MALVTVMLCGIAVAWILWDDGFGSGGDDERSVRVKMQMQGASKTIVLSRNPDDTFTYIVHRYDGASESLTPEQFTRYLYEEETRAGWVARLFNISSPMGLIWVSVGLLGQMLFAGRMIVQWVISEKKRRSVVPPMFWWLSLIGSMMLLAYFLWRRDAVGVLGQATGVFIYVRNLHLIRVAPREAAALAGGAAEVAPMASSAGDSEKTGGA